MGVSRKSVWRLTGSTVWVPVAVVVLVSFWVLEFDKAIISVALSLAMIVIAISDTRSFIIPDALSLPAVPCGLLVSGYLADTGQFHWTVLEHLSAAAMSCVLILAIKEVYARIRKREGLGLGDVNLAAVAGAWLGLSGFSQALLLACVLAIIVVTILHFQSGRPYRATTAVPFGAYFAPSIWLVWFLQQI
mgnify:CR=1 FL=1